MGSLLILEEKNQLLGYFWYKSYLFEQQTFNFFNFFHIVCIFDAINHK
jgi:hypothetical protein